MFGPNLPCPPVFEDPQIFREFLLVKLINGEKATFETPTFARKRERTLDMLIKDLYADHTTDVRMVSGVVFFWGTAKRISNFVGGVCEYELRISGL